MEANTGGNESVGNKISANAIRSNVGKLTFDKEAASESEDKVSEAAPAPTTAATPVTATANESEGYGESEWERGAVH